MAYVSDNVPTEAKQMYALGTRTEQAIKRMFEASELPLFPDADGATGPIPRPTLGILASALLGPPRWSDAQAEALLVGLSQRISRDSKFDLSLVSRWVLAHPDDADSVLTCLAVDPPPEIEIRRVLSRAGSQKMVFLASWLLTQKDVVVKRFLYPGATAQRELESFPINLSHDNIIKTYRLPNPSTGELFLIEDVLPNVLSDSWRAQGVQEAANLLHDVGAATKYLHDHDRVHGDIKPDNIGRRDGLFVLLDFGICRPTAEFTRTASATGSLRTRAPELLTATGYVSPPKVDVWALGATVYSALVGRFPLIKADERVPRITAPPERAAFETELSRRVTHEWDDWVDLSKVPDELRAILSSMLERDPAKRLTSGDVLARINSSLPAYLHGGDARTQREGRFSPLQELDQLDEYLSRLPKNIQLPIRAREGLRERLKTLRATQGFSSGDQQRTADLLSRLDATSI